MIRGFRDFLFRGNVIDLAVAVVIGVAFTAVVQAFTKDIITPIIGIFGGIPDFSAIHFTINGSQFLIGDFINAVLAFVITGAVLYFIVVAPMERIMPRPVITRECPFCLSKVPLKAQRCAFCTSDLSSSMQVGAAGTSAAGPSAISDRTVDKAIEESAKEKS